MMDIRWLTDQLPQARSIQRWSEADYYGASDLIGGALGYATPPRSIASWKHGITYAQDWAYPELMLTEGNRLTRHLVTTRFQVKQLNSRGFIRVHAVGAPFLHVEPSLARRVPRSLLVMPAHSVGNSAHSFDEDGYVEQLLSVRGKFDVIVTCIGAPCVRNGRWTEAFETRGIPWFAGADSTDGNALRRMARVFDSFEYVTTNTLGSHVAYAAYRGCKVSLWGPFAHYKLEDFRDVPWYQENWSKAPEVIESVSEQSIRRRHPFLFRSPWEAEPLQEWAEQSLGLLDKRTPAEMARLLGWSAIGQAELLVHRAAKRCIQSAQAAVRRTRRLSAV